MELGSSDCVHLDAACVELAKSQAVQELIRVTFGDEEFPVALAVMKSGKLQGDLGDSINDLMVDTIYNASTKVWTGFIHYSHDDYAIILNEYYGVYWIWAVEYEPIGYFLDKDIALDFARSNWSNVYEEGEDPKDDSGDFEEGDGMVHCPFCETTENCDHFLLTVDLTFRTAEGGPIYEIFNSKWSDISADQPEREEFDERGAFDQLVEEIESLADAEVRSSPDSAPGLSSNFVHFFCNSKKRTQSAIKKFNSI